MRGRETTITGIGEFCRELFQLTIFEQSRSAHAAADAHGHHAVFGLAATSLNQKDVRSGVIPSCP